MEPCLLPYVKIGQLWSGLKPYDIQPTLLRYHTVKSGTASGIVDYVFRQNDPNDPDAAVGGHQPQFYDAWSNLYQRQYVTWSSIRVEITNVSTAVPLVCHIIPNSESSPPFVNPDDAYEAARSKHVNIQIVGGVNSKVLQHELPV